MKADTVNMFRNIGQGEGAGEAGRANAKGGRKGQAGGIGGASDFAKLLGRSAQGLSADVKHPATGEQIADHQAEQHESMSSDQGLQGTLGRDQQAGEGMNKRPRLPGITPGRAAPTPAAEGMTPAPAHRPSEGQPTGESFAPIAPQQGKQAGPQLGEGQAPASKPAQPRPATETRSSQPRLVADARPMQTHQPAQTTRAPDGQSPAGGTGARPAPGTAPAGKPAPQLNTSAAPAADKPGEAPVPVSAEASGPVKSSGPAPSRGATARPGQVPARATAPAEGKTTQAGQAAPGVEAPRSPSQAVAGPDQRPAGTERRAPQGAVVDPNAAAAKAPSQQGEQTGPARAARPSTPAVKVEGLDQPTPAAGEERELTQAAQGPRVDRRPVRPARPEVQPAASDDERRPTEAPAQQTPVRAQQRNPQAAAFAGQPELTEAQSEARRPSEAQPALPVELAARPKLVRTRERTAGDEELPVEDRKLVRAAGEKEIPALLLMQLAPAPVPTVDLVNARMQAMAREGRRGLESQAIAAAGAGALLEAPGSDSSKGSKSERELPWQGPALALPLDATLPASLNPNNAPMVEGPAAPPLPPGAAPLLDQAALDPGLNVAVMSQAAHMTITHDDGRALELHLRMSPEGADIRATGNLAPMVQARVAELGMALASQGLTLGSFEMGRDGSGRSSRDGEDDRETSREERGERRSVRASSPTGSGAVTNVAGRIHVKV